MYQVKIAEFRNHLSRYLRKVRQGGEVILTDRETPIGRILPFEKSSRDEPWELSPPPRGWGRLARMSFSPLSKNYHVVDDLLAQRHER